jgi:DNA mismatch repair protein MutS
MVKSKGATPVMKQFWDAKKAYPNSLMLFRMGDFYETFDEDAKIASEVLGIALTKRANGAASTVPLAGFPYHAIEQYLHKLLKAGHRVAICEQVEDPKFAKGIVKREVVEVVTPGTSLSERFLEQRENNYLVSVYILKEKFGLSILDHSTGEFLTGEWDLNEIQNVVQQYHPSEIIVSESQKKHLEKLLIGYDYFISTIPDWVSEYNTSYEILTEHFKTQSLKGFGVEDYNLSIVSSGNIIHYIQQNNMGNTHHLTSLSIIQDEGVMALDSFTIRNLEIFSSLANQGIHGTLISVLDRTITSAGGRLLKRWIRRPLAVKENIEKRLNRVEEFITNRDLREDVVLNLREVSDIDRIIARISAHRASPRDVINLANSLSKVSIFREVFTNVEPALNTLISESRDTSKIVDSILTTLKSEPPANISKGGYVENGFSKELDEYRQLSNNANEWLVKYQIEEQEKTSIPKLKVGYNRVFGYYIEISKIHIDKIPENYIRKQTLTNAERYFTPELKEYENKILSAEDKIISLETKIFQELCNSILQSASEIQHNALILAKLDIALGLAEVAEHQQYSRPTILDDNSLDLHDSRHPVVEKLLPIGESFIPNDLQLNCKTRQVAIITGPNMAGKSTYLRQVGLVVIMAQMGSYVPASLAKIGIVDKLFTRVGASDNLAGGESTFLVEMNETANILNNATSKSLIILDEIGRGTSTYDGLSIAWAVTEHIHNFEAISAKTLFATHYHELVKLADDLPKAFNLNIAVKEFGNRVVFLRKIIEGGADKSYGIHVAEMAGLPKPVIQRSHEILTQLMSGDKEKLSSSLEVKQTVQTNLFDEKEHELQDELSELNINQLTPMEALLKLDEMKKKHGL